MLAFFGSTIIQEDVKNTIIKNALKSNTNCVRSDLEKYNIDVNNSNLVDDCAQNLLHIAARTKNYELARYLISRKIDKTKINLFNETPKAIALKNNDVQMFEIIMDYDSLSYCKIENIKLNGRITDLELNNAKLIDTNKDLTLKNDVLVLQLEEEKKSKKRKLDDDGIHLMETKRLKTEIVQLRNDNNVLSNTVKSLRESMKKK